MALLNRKIDRYMELVAEFPLKAIHNDKDLGKAEKMLHALLDIEELNKDERDYVEVLGKLIKDYETEAHPIEDVSEADVLVHLIEVRGNSTTQRSVAKGTGIPESTISELVAGRRDFNRHHIEKLAAFFHVSPAVFFKTNERVTA